MKFPIGFNAHTVQVAKHIQGSLLYCTFPLLLALKHNKQWTAQIQPAQEHCCLD